MFNYYQNQKVLKYWVCKRSFEHSFQPLTPLGVNGGFNPTLLRDMANIVFIKLGQPSPYKLVALILQVGLIILN